MRLTSLPRRSLLFAEKLPPLGAVPRSRDVTRDINDTTGSLNQFDVHGHAVSNQVEHNAPVIVVETYFAHDVILGTFMINVVSLLIGSVLLKCVFWGAGVLTDTDLLG